MYNSMSNRSWPKPQLSMRLLRSHSIYQQIIIRKILPNLLTISSSTENSANILQTLVLTRISPIRWMCYNRQYIFNKWDKIWLTVNSDWSKCAFKQAPKSLLILTLIMFQGRSDCPWIFIPTFLLRLFSLQRCRLSETQDSCITTLSFTVLSCIVFCFTAALLY